MKKNKIDRKMMNSLLISLIVFSVILIGGTFAWLSYQSKKSALVLTIDGVNDTKVTLSPYQINASMTPVDTYTSGVCSEVSVVNSGSSSTLVTLFYKINELDQNLVDNGLQYTITSSSTKNGTYSLVNSGDFTEAVVGEDFLILEAEIEASGSMYYKVYLWVEDLEQDQSVIQNSVLDLELYGSLTSSSGIPTFTYTGDYLIVDDDDNTITDVASYEGNWKIKFLTSGTFVSSNNVLVDIFLVGGGGGGGSKSAVDGGGGGGGGYTNTGVVNIKKGQSYEIVVGAGGAAATDGQATTAFGAIAYGGNSGKGYIGGNGGSGGGGGGYSNIVAGQAGGSGGNAGSGSWGSGGSGQITTTREFGEPTGKLYSGGGGGGSGYNISTGSAGSSGAGGSGGGKNGGSSNASASDNTGGGGGGQNVWNAAGTGGSGIVIIRNSRVATSIELDYQYTGYHLYSIGEDGNWKIEFYTSGTFTSNKSVEADVFLVGGGGGGGSGTSTTGGGGGGGGYTNTAIASIVKDQNYEIVIGAGGAAATDGQVTTAFDLQADGGKASVGNAGGAGGSGGGSGGYYSSSSYYGKAGGSDGNNGTSGKYSGGSGQGFTTREFGDSTATLYSGGGGGGRGFDNTSGSYGRNGASSAGGGSPGGSSQEAAANTGGGGGGGGGTGSGGAGGSGIVVIRNSQSLVEDTLYLFDSSSLYTSVTGGWTNSGWAYSGSTYNSGASAGTVLSASLSDDQYSFAAVGTVNQIDLTNYNTLYFTADECKGGCGVFISSTKTINPVELNWYHQPYDYDYSGDATIDISSVNGSYYVVVVAVGSASHKYPSIKVSSIYAD